MRLLSLGRAIKSPVSRFALGRVVISACSFAAFRRLTSPLLCLAPFGRASIPSTSFASFERATGFPCRCLSFRCGAIAAHVIALAFAALCQSQRGSGPGHPFEFLYGFGQLSDGRHAANHTPVGAWTFRWPVWQWRSVQNPLPERSKKVLVGKACGNGVGSLL